MKTNNLASKYRPQKLSAIVGQKPVVEELKNLFEKKQIHSSILLSGPSGVGKTTIARIIGRYLNCDTFNACGKCDHCTTMRDVTEVNGSSNRGIDDMRSLISLSKVKPFTNYKVIIVDECHNLTDYAMQAWLKPLEEPTESTIWILCTTLPDKLPATILGRCHRFNLDYLSSEDLSLYIRRVAKREGARLSKQVYSAIADLSEGKCRDAVHLLESALNIDSTVNMSTLLSSSFFQELAGLDETAVTVLSSALNGDLKKALYSIRITKDTRSLLMKMLYLVQSLIDRELGIQEHSSFSMKLFDKTKVKARLEDMLLLQRTLITTGHSSMVDENILLASAVARYIDTLFE